MAVLRLKPKRERSVLQRHPWLFSGAIADVTGDPGIGDTVDIVSGSGEWLARGAFSPHSQIRCRLWTWTEDEAVDVEFLRQRLDRSIRRRASLHRPGELTAFREVYAESDAVPGVIVDRYDRFRVVQFLTAGAERWREAILGCLADRGDCDGIYERSDVDVRGLEGLPLRAGPAWGQMPPEDLVIVEDGLRYRVDVVHGQKTGLYLDQRENHKLLRSLLAGGEVLNCFAYTGGFTLAALAGGAEKVVSIESSGAALQLARQNVALNGLVSERCEWLEGDVFVELRRMRDRGLAFDAIVLDPPRFAATASQAHRAARGYKDINLLGFKLLRPGGLLFTFSCSGGIGVELFEKIVADAALDAGVQASVVAWLAQPMDHPVALNFPEGRYLKGLVCRRAERA
jgi:23S rRNA (cytosine1962-C5)-methyltransferase